MKIPIRVLFLLPIFVQQITPKFSGTTLWPGTLGGPSTSLSWDHSCSCGHLMARWPWRAQDELLQKCWLLAGMSWFSFTRPLILQEARLGFFTAWWYQDSKRAREEATGFLRPKLKNFYITIYSIFCWTRQVKPAQIQARGETVFTFQ